MGKVTSALLMVRTTFFADGKTMLPVGTVVIAYLNDAIPRIFVLLY